MSMNRKFFIAASMLGALSVIFGAFGAHALKARLEPDQLLVFETGVRYQMCHAIVLLVLSVLSEKFSSKYINYAFWCFVIGILFFSGSIYLLSTRTILGIEGFTKILGPITPLGGLLLISGWGLIFISALTSGKMPKDL